MYVCTCQGAMWGGSSYFFAGSINLSIKIKIKQARNVILGQGKSVKHDSPEIPKLSNVCLSGPASEITNTHI